MTILMAIREAPFMAFSMFWEILWPLVLGFTLSGIVQAVVSHQAIAKALGGDSPKHLTLTTVLNILFLVLAAILVIRFLRTGGASMLKMMK